MRDEVQAPPMADIPVRRHRRPREAVSRPVLAAVLLSLAAAALVVLAIRALSGPPEDARGASCASVCEMPIEEADNG